jgi:hypothetical protein
MQVSFADLTMWSFLMASAHGAGFMLLPFVLPAGDALAAADQTHAGHVTPASASPPLGPLTDGLAAGIHTLAYLMVMTLVAWLVYRKLGLGLLRRAWLNMDWVWAAALATTGIAVWLM